MKTKLLKPIKFIQNIEDQIIKYKCYNCKKEVEVTTNRKSLLLLCLDCKIKEEMK
jgi:DNA-directed RNA polymerase subunit RPC12/RpoP